MASWGWAQMMMSCRPSWCLLSRCARSHIMQCITVVFLQCIILSTANCSRMMLGKPGLYSYACKCVGTTNSIPSTAVLCCAVISSIYQPGSNTKDDLPTHTFQPCSDPPTVSRCLHGLAQMHPCLHVMPAHLARDGACPGPLFLLRVPDCSNLISPNKQEECTVWPVQSQRVVSVACGAEHTLACCEDGLTVAFGWGRYGNLGDGHRSDRCVSLPLPCFF